MLQIFCFGLASVFLILSGRIVIGAYAFTDKKVQQSGNVVFALVLLFVLLSAIFIVNTNAAGV